MRLHRWNPPFRNPTALARCAFALSILTLSIDSGMCKPRPLRPPLPSLGRIHTEGFDQPLRLPASPSPDPSVWAESWSGYCLDRTASAVVPWVIPMTLTNRVWVDPSSGAVRFWYRPAYDTGTGPDYAAALLTLVSANGSASVTWWTLTVAPDGRTLSLLCQDGASLAPCLSAPAAFQAGAWQLITLGYSPTNSALFINDTLAAVGAGLPALPALVVPYTSLIVGSGGDGLQTAAGQIEELSCFSGAGRLGRLTGSGFGLSTQRDIAHYWSRLSLVAALGPITPEEEAAQAQARAERLTARQMAARAMPMGLEGPDGPQDSPEPPCGTNDLYTVWLADVTCTNIQGQHWMVAFTIAGGTNGALYDVFGTAALADPARDADWFWLTNGYACDRLTLTNQWTNGGFYILGTPLDTDAGTLSDAYENLVTHGNIQDPSDDRPVPLVGITVVDAVAVEQQSTNTATFLVTRLGGRMNQSLTIGCQLSGTASNGVDYYLSPVTTTATNVLVTIPAGWTNIQITVTPISNTNIEGSETVTLTLTTNVAPCELDLAHDNATAWILEQYRRTYTTVADFNLGVLDGLEAAAPLPDGQLQFKTNLPPQFPFINVACSDRGTVARINTTNGQVVGEYRTAPASLPYAPSPSRTTVDQYGNVWVANREDSFPINGTNYGSITRIGLIVGGDRYTKSGTNYTPSTHGQYVKVGTTEYNTCIDRDGDGYIRTSSGLAVILPWNNSAGADSEGGVSTAEDEAITEYTRVPCTGTRTIAVDKFNDIWVGGNQANRTHLKVSGLLALPVPNSAFDAGYGGYGGVIDSLGNLWSSAEEGGYLVWLTPPTNLPPQQGTDWQALNAGPSGYGIAVDPLYPYIWQTTGGDSVFRWHTNGSPVTNVSGNVILYPHGASSSQGLAVDVNGHVWVAHHKQVSHALGHLNTNGMLVGVVELRVSGLWAEYFDNTNLAGSPVLSNWEAGPVDYSSVTNWPSDSITNAFSARWSGVVQPQAQGEHVFYVSADVGAAFRLRVNGATIIDNWSQPATNPVALAGTNWLGTNAAYDLRLEYAHFTNGAQVTLSWLEPGMTNKEVVPSGRFGPFVDPLTGITLSEGATGVSVDAAGKIWAGCWDTDTAVRIDPNAGLLVVTPDGQTNHLGLVEMVVRLGNGTWHPAPYNQHAHPYNYSDMTGFNVRAVNPGLQPYKGYWVVINDSTNTGQLWNKVSWSADAALTNGCSIEVYVRAADERTWLGSEDFIQATNDVVFPALRGRYIEVRLAMTRDDPSKQPVLYDLTLYGVSSSFAGEDFLYGGYAQEGEDAVFWTDLVGAEPVGYRWFRKWPWETSLTEVVGETNSYLTITNVDSWVDGYVDENNAFHGTLVAVLVTNANAESLWRGPEYLVVDPVGVDIPATNYPSFQGPATRYPMTLNVFGMPTNFSRVSVTATLRSLFHNRSADMSILLVSPLDKEVMLMSNLGGTNGVSNASVAFRQDALPPSESGPILPPNQYYVEYRPSNYGGVSQMPQVGPDPPPTHTGQYSADLNDLQYDDPNGVWKLYIYDTVTGMKGHLDSSWQLGFKVE